MHETELLHSSDIQPVIERVLSLQKTCAAANEGDISGTAENIGVCQDCLSAIAQESAGMLLEAAWKTYEETGNPLALIPATILTAAFQEGLLVGMILGRENPR